MRKFFSKKTVMWFSIIILIFLSSIKIITGLQLASQGMLNEGFENLTDLIKIGIVFALGIRLKKDRLASTIIILLMIITGISLIWSGIEALFNLSPITPTINAYLICIVSIVLNVILLGLKSIVGRNSANLSLLSDSKDSGVNIKISTGVIIGLTFAIFNYYFVDALVGTIIGVFIFKDGIEILREILVKNENFDITTFKVMIDKMYESRLSGYIFASIRREKMDRRHLIENFQIGLELGRKYYHGFADFFYKDLGTEIAEKHIDKLIKGNFIEEIDGTLILTPMGLKHFYKSKSKEYTYRAKQVYEGVKIRRGQVVCILFFLVLILLIVFANDINIWLNSI